jgi:hypothetical protein
MARKHDSARPAASEAPPDATAVEYCQSLSAVSDEQQTISGHPCFIHRARAFKHHQEAALPASSWGF